MSPQLYEFHLPLSPEELLKSGGVNQYVVQEVLSIKHLPSHLKGKMPQLPLCLALQNSHPHVVISSVCSTTPLSSMRARNMSFLLFFFP